MCRLLLKFILLWRGGLFSRCSNVMPSIKKILAKILADLATKMALTLFTYFADIFFAISDFDVCDFYHFRYHFFLLLEHISIDESHMSIRFVFKQKTIYGKSFLKFLSILDQNAREIQTFLRISVSINGPEFGNYLFSFNYGCKNL